LGFIKINLIPLERVLQAATFTIAFPRTKITNDLQKSSILEKKVNFVTNKRT
jgi:hypothetical protein